MRRLHKFLRLAPDERAALVEAWSLYLVAELALRLGFLARLVSFSRMAPRRRWDGSVSRAPSIPRLSWVVEVAGRYAPLRATCLKSALVLSWLLRKRGVATILRIGVARRAGILDAHAWLEHEGQVIHGFTEDRYEPIFSAGIGGGGR